jgi:acetylornithine deacetylase/succinyl-diaminopimelate desuccinylase-like protein
MMVRSVGLPEPLELSVFSVDDSGFVDSPVERGGPIGHIRTPVSILVYGEIPAANAERTIIFYAHYDGQPLDPREWATPPWEPVLKDGRIYARSASDDKAPMEAPCAALDSLAAAKIPIRSHIKFVFEG